MAQESVAVVLDDLRLMLNDGVATHGFACMGLVLIPDLFERFPPPPENPDPIIYLGVGDPNLPSAKQYAEWRHSQALEQVARNGRSKRASVNSGSSTCSRLGSTSFEPD